MGASQISSVETSPSMFGIMAKTISFSNIFFCLTEMNILVWLGGAYMKTMQLLYLHLNVIYFLFPKNQTGMKVEVSNLQIIEIRQNFLLGFTI